ncbi:MAG: hypothetical protein QW273_01335 [Candidatus Pacearchaeota archaeon]
MVKYRNRIYNFEIDLPKGWRYPSIIMRLLRKDKNPEFYGPKGESLKFAIGKIFYEPSLEEQQKNLERIAQMYDHEVVEIGSINVCGKEHATMICRIPFVKMFPAIINQSSPYLFRRISFITLKNYSIILKGLEYLATADLQGFQEKEYDDIIKTFRLV